MPSPKRLSLWLGSNVLIKIAKLSIVFLCLSWWLVLTALVQITLTHPPTHPHPHTHPNTRTHVHTHTRTHTRMCIFVRIKIFDHERVKLFRTWQLVSWAWHMKCTHYLHHDSISLVALDFLWKIYVGAPELDTAYLSITSISKGVMNQETCDQAIKLHFCTIPCWDDSQICYGLKDLTIYLCSILNHSPVSVQRVNQTTNIRCQSFLWTMLTN